MWNKQQNQTLQADDQYQPVQYISDNFEANQAYLKNLFVQCSDIILHETCMGNGTKLLILEVDGLVDTAQIDELVLQTLIRSQPDEPASLDEVIHCLLPVGQASKIDTMTDAIDRALTGETLLFMDGCRQAIAVSARKWEHRSPSEPETEAVVRGPREGFNENLRVNTSMLRRRIRSPHLKVEGMKIGRITKTDVVLAYIEGIATDSVVDELRNRLQRIDVDGVLDSGYIEEFIEDHPFSLFPQIQPTERPDTVTANLLEGRCVIFADGSPFALIAPINLWGALQATEDYYERFIISCIIRWIRYLFTVISLLLPSLYIAITTFHQEMLPTTLLLSLAAARESSPFPALVEALMMEITFEALREAGIRLPKTIGQAVSIVGALVIGQAAVEAGIISAPMVIVVALTGIANFAIPRYSFALAIRMLRFPLMLLAGTLGLYGIVIGLIVIFAHLCSLKSVKLPYLAPIAPLKLSGLKDTFLRVPLWLMNKRPKVYGNQNRVRIPKGQRPHPPKPEEE